VSEAVSETKMANLVVDPVFVSKHGHSLLREDAVDALRTRLVPLATLVTPNLHEASGLAGIPVATDQDMEKAGQLILELGPEAVLVKGGHREGEEATDLLITPEGIQPFSSDRIDTSDTHGTGCVLSAAIASYLARGEELVAAVAKGKEFVTEAIRHALRLGQGIGPVDPSWGLKEL
jgi:hydroxymethylpyrimidine/phosphomethylpyrimidine kinase